jgi:hypothetical protein
MTPPPAHPDPNSSRRLAEGLDAIGSGAPRPGLRGLVGFAPQHRFRLMMLACALGLAALLAEGFGPVWPAPPSPRRRGQRRPQLRHGRTPSEE